MFVCFYFICFGLSTPHLPLWKFSYFLILSRSAFPPVNPAFPCTAHGNVHFLTDLSVSAGFSEAVQQHDLITSVHYLSELSSNPSLASILIPAHARNQAVASTPTNASATTGQSRTSFSRLSSPLSTWKRSLPFLY